MQKRISSFGKLAKRLLCILMMLCVLAPMIAITPARAEFSGKLTTAELPVADNNFTTLEELERNKLESAGTLTPSIMPTGATIMDTSLGLLSSLVPQFGSNGKFLAPIEEPVAGSIPISNRTQLSNIRFNMSGNYHLTADIDLSNNEWEPIGGLSERFTGTFDGQGHIISNLTITGDNFNYLGINYIGLFGAVTGNATIKNVGLENTYIDISTSSEAAGIVGYVADSASISNCYNTGDVSSSGSMQSRVGGIVGFISGWNDEYDGYVSVSDCYNTGNISSSASGSSTRAGGIVGVFSESADNIGFISNCFNTGSVSSSSALNYTSDAGGIVGASSISVSISNCSNTGAVTSPSSSSFTGGIVGNLDIFGSSSDSVSCSISYCYNTGDISSVSGSTSSSSCTGGIIGIISGSSNYITGVISISDCYNIGDISSSFSNFSTTSSSHVGGIAGSISYSCSLFLSISNCFNTGDQYSFASSSSAASSSHTGGIVGSGFISGSINNCYSTGVVFSATYPVPTSTPLSSFAGGIAGYVDSTLDLVNCYWRTESDQIVNYVVRQPVEQRGIGNNTDTSTGRLTDALMKDHVNYVTNYAGFDFNDVWYPPMDNGYPALRAFPEIPLFRFPITISTLANGSITATPTTAVAGKVITLTIKPDHDYLLMESTLKYNGIVINGNSFIMPDEPVTILAEFAPIADYWQFVDNGPSITITKLINLINGDTNIRIPGVINEKPVTEVGAGTFANIGGITAVTIPDSVTEIGEYAFGGCTGLKNITIPDSVVSIGNSAFSYCISLESIAIPNSIVSIGNSAFSSCTSLDSVTIPDSITSIGDGVFSDCSNLVNIKISSSVTTIGNSSFEKCLKLTSITLPDVVTAIGDRAFYGCTGLGSIVIPEGVTFIGNSAFYGCANLVSITIPNGIDSIGDNTFYGCTNLVSITIPDSVTSIGYSAFHDCTSLMSITIPNGVTAIEYSTFYSCTSLSNVSIPDSVDAIGSYAFFGCTELIRITIPINVKSIDDFAFIACSELEEVYFKSATPPSVGLRVFDYVKPGARAIVPEGVSDYGVIGSQWNNLVVTYASTPVPVYHTIDVAQLINGAITAVPNCIAGTNILLTITPDDGYQIKAGTLKYNDIIISGNSFIMPHNNVIITAEFEFIWKYTDNGDGVTITGYIGISTTPVIPSTIEGIPVVSIGNSAFIDQKNLECITITNSIISIGESAFRGCTNLESVILPSNDQFTTIADNAFYGCSALESFIIPNSVEAIGSAAFYGCSSLASIIISDSVEVIGSAAFSNCLSLESISLPNNAQFARIEKNTFSSCTNLISIVIPNSIISIGEQAFLYCQGLVDITIADSVKHIESGAFSNCTNLVSITIPDSVESIGISAFSFCDSLESIKLPNNKKFTSIRGLFYVCTNLINITIPDSVTTIETSSFSNCSNLASITIPNSVESIGSQAFYNCISLESIIIPDSVKSIGEGAFSNCTNLVNIKLPNNDNYTSIDYREFQRCASLESIMIPDCVLSISSSAFSYCTNLEFICFESIIPPTVVFGNNNEQDTFFSIKLDAKAVIPPNATAYGTEGDLWNGLIVTFKQNATTYTITASAATGGTVSGGGEYSEGAPVTLTANPNTGYFFEGWFESGLLVSRNSQYTFTASSDRTLQAKFTQEIDAEEIAGELVELFDGIDDIDPENIEPADEAAINSAVEGLNDFDVNLLAAAMQTSEEVLEYIKTLESLYNAINNVTVVVALDNDLEDMIGSEYVSIVGAGLNAAVSGEIVFSVAKSDADVTIDGTLYKNVIKVHITLDGSDIDPEKLAVPVVITVPVPKGIDPKKFVILHYDSNGVSYELITPIINSDGTASFILTYFSEFVFAEEAEDELIAPGDVNKDGKVDATDLSMLISDFGKSGNDITYPGSDVNKDGKVDATDLSILISNFGT